MAVAPDRPPPAYPSEEVALASAPHRDLSQACDTFSHKECRLSRPPTEIVAGPRAGQWSATWECSCPCHRPKTNPE